jgi:hypothetical protein
MSGSRNLKVTSLQSGLDAINRLETRNRQKPFDVKGYISSLDKLCPYDFLDCLDMEYGIDTKPVKTSISGSVKKHVLGSISSSHTR